MTFFEAVEAAQSGKIVSLNKTAAYWDSDNPDGLMWQDDQTFVKVTGAIVRGNWQIIPDPPPTLQLHGGC